MGVVSTVEAILRAIRSRGEPEEIEADKDVAEEINKALPEAVSGREGLMAYRKRQRLLDENWEKGQ
jgi:hypothetical protein